MSRHHVLPSLVYVPQPKPKPIDNRKRRIQVGGDGTFEGMEETGETHVATASDRSTPAFNARPPQNFTAIEGSEGKPRHPGGRLSEGTLKAMLAVQEFK